MAPSSPHARRIVSSLSNWIELVSMATLAAKRLNPSGRRGEYQIVRFGSGAGTEVVQRLQEAEAGLRHQRAPVVAHPADRLGDPRRIAREQLVVLGRAQEPDDAQLDDEVVDDLLGLFLGERARREIAREIDIEERGGPSERHRRAVLFLHAGEIAEVQPLHGFSRVARRARDVESVRRRHLLKLFERTDLFGSALRDRGSLRRSTSPSRGRSSPPASAR